ncbi:MAG: YfcE family phosphodiesterase [Bacilli bacterium]|nr:YfcE family phosphodiesterase [Bacilli bacterium]
MKAIIASDIHGNLIYTQSLEELILKENPDKLILLGDYFSSYENYEVIDILNKYSDIICAVRGNCDYLEERCKFDYNHDYLIVELDNYKFFCTHGHTMYLKEMIEKSKGMYILSGHTHVYKIHGNNLNPGSVGRPRENPEHTCLLYKNKTMYLIDLDNLNCIDKRNMP